MQSAKQLATGTVLQVSEKNATSQGEYASTDYRSEE